jgi:hypothetical protein
MATDASSSRGGPADGIGCVERFVRQFAQSQRHGFRFATTQYADFHGGARPHAAVRRASARKSRTGSPLREVITSHTSSAPLAAFLPLPRHQRAARSRARAGSHGNFRRHRLDLDAEPAARHGAVLF